MSVLIILKALVFSGLICLSVSLLDAPLGIVDIWYHETINIQFV